MPEFKFDLGDTLQFGPNENLNTHHNSNKPEPKSERQASSYLRSLSSDELWAVACFLKAEISDRTDTTIKNCIAELNDANDPHLYPHIEDICIQLFELTSNWNINDKNAYRAITILLKQIRQITNKKALKIFTKEKFSTKNFLAEMLINIHSFRISEDELNDISRWFIERWVSVLSSHELKTNKLTIAEQQIFLEILNSELQKKAPRAHEALSFDEFLLEMDYVLGHEKDSRELFLKRARAALARKKNRNKQNAKQKNLTLHKNVIEKIAELSRRYNLSEAQMISILVVGESKTPTHLEKHSRLLSVTEQTISGEL